jgi:hypothetical protein
MAVTCTAYLHAGRMSCTLPAAHWPPCSVRQACQIFAASEPSVMLPVYNSPLQGASRLGHGPGSRLLQAKQARLQSWRVYMVTTKRSLLVLASDPPCPEQPLPIFTLTCSMPLGAKLCSLVKSVSAGHVAPAAKRSSQGVRLHLACCQLGLQPAIATGSPV